MRNRISGASRLLWLALVSCCAVHPLLSQTLPSAQSVLEREFQAAMAAQDKGDLDGARSILLKIRQKKPGIFAVDESLGMIYAAQSKFAEAVPFLEAAVREQPSSDAAHANLGAALYRLHRNAEALTAFERAAQLNPANPTTQQSLAQLLLETGKPDQAAQAYSAALRLKPGDNDLIFGYATALVAAKHYNEAAQALSMAQSEYSAEAQLLLGEIDEANARYESAGKHFARAVELDPSEGNLWALGVEFLRHWTFEAAIREFQAGVAKFPSSTRMKLGLATAYFGDAKYGESIPVFADLLRVEKNNSLYAEMLGMACSADSSAAKSDCSVLVQYARTHPRDGRAATYAATQLLTETSSQSQILLGKKLLAEALAADPKSPQAQYLMGLAKQNDGDWRGSIPYLERSIALKPNLAQAHYRLALACWRTGRKQQAQSEMDLQKKYAQQQRDDLNDRLRQITTFVVDVRQ
ncbi:MAG: tetratricopeptide repeat protein [Acidobacteriota bacterium]